MNHQYEYRLAWQCKRSGVEEQSVWTVLDDEALKALHADKRDKQRKYPDLDYWIEERQKRTSDYRSEI